MADSVVVTGTGCISALGAGVGESLRNLYDGVVQPPEAGRMEAAIDTPPPVFSVNRPLASDDDPLLTRTTALALAAVEEAITAARGRRQPDAPAHRVGVVFGTTVGCTFNEEAFYRAYRAGEAPGPLAIRRYLANELSAAVADRIGARGPAVTIANACASGTDAIGVGRRWLLSGLCDLVVAGGADELARFAYLGFFSLKNCSPERCRPFDLDRRGLNLGEGAAALVLERGVDALARGADVVAEIAGYATAADAHHMTAPHPEGRGLRQAVAAALGEAGLRADQLDLVNAHGTGTAENDRVEGRVLADLLGPGTPVLSTKGYTGHTLGAAGALEAVLTAHNLLDGRVPASAGFATADPECRITPVTSCQATAARWALSTSLAFGGANSALVLLRGGEA